MLLDDVLSELDEARQSYLLSRMEHRQTIVTACDAALFAKTDGQGPDGRQRRVKRGCSTKAHQKQVCIFISGRRASSAPEDILGIFDLDYCHAFPAHAGLSCDAPRKQGRVVNCDGRAAQKLYRDYGENRPAVYISQISAGTLKKRSGYVDGISNIEK